MQSYGSTFAAIYNRRWGNFAQTAAPRIRAWFETTPVGQTERRMVDLCCGTGQLAAHFLDNGYQVTGIDLSEPMLEFARANNAPYIVTGQARFKQGDAARFIVDGSFGLVVSTFDALNHLPSLDALRGCFYSVFPLLVPGGAFVFDLNTFNGLRRWQSISIDDTEELMLVIRGVFDPETNKAHTYISGFSRAVDGRYDRFEETAYNLGYRLVDVEAALRETGFERVRFCRGSDLSVPVEDPEAEARVWIIAEKGLV